MTKSDFKAFLDYVKAGDLISIKQHFDPEYLELENEDSLKPIHVAAKAGKLEIVKYFHQRHCNLEDCDDNGFAPIHYAVRGGYLDIVQYLVENGCDVDRLDDNEKRPADIASENGHIEIVAFLFHNNIDLETSNSIGMKPIDYACEGGQIEIVKFFFQNKLDLEQPNLNGERPIHFACQRGQIEIVKFFFQNKLDLEQPNLKGERPIHHAIKGLHIEIVKYLIRHHCDTEAKTNKGLTPLDIAKDLKNKDMIELLESNNLRLKIMRRIEVALTEPCEISCNHSCCSKEIFLKRSQNQNCLDKGSYGSVYKINDPQTKVDIAVKVIEGLSVTENLENRINDYRDKLFHERIIQYYFAFNKDNKMHIFMECAVLGSLYNVIEMESPLEHLKIIRYTQQILEGLEFLHKNHIIHRDVKPKNILKFQNDCIKLCDFGFSREIDSISIGGRNGGASSALGTANYMAPELLDGKRYDYAVDIWSLGVSMIQMLTGKAPYSDLTPQAVIFKIGTEKSIKFEPYQPMSKEFTKFHSSMLEKNPLERPIASKLLIEIKHLL